MILKSINGYFYYSCIDPFILTIEMHIIELNNIKNTRVWYKRLFIGYVLYIISKVVPTEDCIHPLT